MKKFLLLIILFQSSISFSHALIINEIMSNPLGDDSGREWIEIYNETDSPVDLSTLTISIKGGNAVVATPLQGGTLLSHGDYAIIGSTVSSATKFLQDYPLYNGILFKSSISLVNTGVTSIDIKVGGNIVDSLSSYTAAKEGLTLSRISGSFVSGNPTPGTENQAVSQDISTQTPPNSTTTDTQSTVAQISPPNADIILFMPTEKIVVAGVESQFSVFGLTRAGKNIDNLTYVWAYGDGGYGTGSTTLYRYAYPGRYIVSVEGNNGYIAGTGRMYVRVVSPDILINKVATGKFGNYIDISNPNNYDMDLSQWKLSIEGAIFPFPKNTLIAGNNITHFSGLSMGFASTTISSSTIVKILFPNMEEVTRYVSSQEIFLADASSSFSKAKSLALNNFTQSTNSKLVPTQIKPQGRVLGTTTSNLKDENNWSNTK